MARWFAVATLCLACLALADDTRRPTLGDIDQQKFVFLAVLEGAYEDGVSAEALDSILRREPETERPLHFVPACPICMPAHDALATYRRRAPFSLKPKNASDPRSSNTFGEGVAPDLARKLESADLAERLAGLNGLIERWVRRRLDLLRLSPDERREWTAAIEAGRQRGMGYLEQYQKGGLMKGFKGCAVCDGASGACGRP